MVRSLIEQVSIIPADDRVTIELKGGLAGILVLPEGAKRCSGSLGDRALQIKMVAGARSQLYRTTAFLSRCLIVERRSWRARQAPRRMN